MSKETLSSQFERETRYNKNKPCYNYDKMYIEWLESKIKSLQQPPAENEMYHGWSIEGVNERGYYAATCLNDCDEFILVDRDLISLKEQIDERKEILSLSKYRGNY